MTYEHLRYQRMKCIDTEGEQVQKQRAQDYEEYQKKYNTLLYHKLTCLKCKKTFYARRAYAKYCSYRCRNDVNIEARRQRHTSKRKKHCTACGKFFEALRDDTIFCSAACKQKWYRSKHVTVKGCSIAPQLKNVTNVTDIGLAEISQTESSNAGG